MSQEIKPAEPVLRLDRGIKIDDLINDCLALTWVHEAEHTVVKLIDGDRLIIRGGRDGIQFLVKGEGGRRTLHMEIAGREVQVTRIFGHTHPMVTGPSDGDLEALAILKQTRSYIVELGSGNRYGTLIRPKRRRPAS